MSVLAAVAIVLLVLTVLAAVGCLLLLASELGVLRDRLDAAELDLDLLRDQIEGGR